MAFLGKVGNILGQSVAKHINPEFSASTPSIYQAIRCMSSKIFVGGLSYTTDDQSLKDAFGNYGDVIEARVIMDRESGRSKGFGFVTYTCNEDASSAIKALNGQDLHGRRVRVDYATEKFRPTGFGSDGGFGGGGGGYGGGGYGGNNGASYRGGGGYNDGGAGGGNYSSNFASGGGGGYGGGNTFDSVSGGNFSVAGGGGGPGCDNNYSSGAYGGRFSGSTGSGDMGDVAGGINQGDPMEGNFRDDDDDSDLFAKRG